MVENEGRLSSLLIGEYEHSLDVKGRIIMPAKFREDIGEHFVVTRGLEECLFIYPKDKWDDIIQKLNKLPFSVLRDMVLLKI